jgi:hypothetical protein
MTRARYASYSRNLVDEKPRIQLLRHFSGIAQYLTSTRQAQNLLSVCHPFKLHYGIASPHIVFSLTASGTCRTLQGALGRCAMQNTPRPFPWYVDLNLNLGTLEAAVGAFSSPAQCSRGHHAAACTVFSVDYVAPGADLSDGVPRRSIAANFIGSGVSISISISESWMLLLPAFTSLSDALSGVCVHIRSRPGRDVLLIPLLDHASYSIQIVFRVQCPEQLRR